MGKHILWFRARSTDNIFPTLRVKLASYAIASAACCFSTVSNINNDRTVSILQDLYSCHVGTRYELCVATTKRALSSFYWDEYFIRTQIIEKVLNAHTARILGKTLDFLRLQSLNPDLDNDGTTSIGHPYSYKTYMKHSKDGKFPTNRKLPSCFQVKQ